MSVLLQISDPHFGTEQPRVAEALRQLHQQLAPDVVVVSGDITQRARRGQFDAARRFFDSLTPSTLLAIPGNHDIPLFNLASRVLSPYAGYARVFGDTRDDEYASDHWFIVCVDTTRPWRHKHGEISSDQIAHVARRVASATSAQLRVVVTHHPIAVSSSEDRRNLLRGHAAAIASWTDAGVDIVLGGHIHLPAVMRASAAVDGTRPLWAVQAGTALSSRTRGRHPNSVTVVRKTVDAGVREARVEQWDFDEGVSGFVLAHTTTLALAPR